MLLSGCVIVKNEAKLLDGCLQSLHEFVDEIVVVDNGSTDNSAEVAGKYNANIIYLPEANHDGGRSAYVNAAKSDWIIVLDADERITKEDGKKIRDFLIKQENNNLLGCLLPRYDYLGDGKWAYINILRLFQNDKKVYYNKINAHASVAKSIQDNKGEIGFFPASIHHIDVLLPSRTKNKRERNIKRIKTDIDTSIKNGIHYNMFLHCFLGLEYTAAENYQDAVKEYSKAMESDNNEAIAEGKIFYAQAMIKCGKYKLAQELALNALVNNKERCEKALFILAEINIRRRYYDNAISIAKFAVNKYPYMAHWYINLAFLYRDTDIGKSKDLIEKAIKINPYLLESIIYNYGEKPNIFEQQTSFLSITGTVFDILIQYYDEQRDIESKNYWQKEYDRIVLKK